MKQYLLIFISALFCFYSCKKHGGNPAPVAVTTTAPFITGYLYADIYYALDTPKSVSANFYYDSLHKGSLNIGTVTCNGDTLFCDPGFNYQYGLPPLGLLSGQNWVIPSSMYFNGFTTSFGTDMPVYTGTLPDTIITLNGATFNMSAAVTNNSDSATLILGNYYGQNTFCINDGDIYLSAIELNNIDCLSASVELNLRYARKLSERFPGVSCTVQN